MPTMPIIDVWMGSIPADNHEPTRDYYVVTGTVHAADPDVRVPVEVVVLTCPDTIKDWQRAVYLLDDGATVRPHYVGGWNREVTRLYLEPFPANPDGRTRYDGRVIDYSTWALGPRRCYHVKIRRTS